MKIESVWRCNTCSEFTDHTDIRQVHIPPSVNSMYEGICPKCKTKNANVFLKKEPCNIFGSGEIKIVPIDPIDFTKKYDHEIVTRMTKQEIKEIYGKDFK